ncbi:MAG: cytochrome c3 family protein [Thermodesulfovibrionales bacterium]
MALSLLTGCGGQNGYKVLSFFFDGVPNPDEPSDKDKEALRKKKPAEGTMSKGAYREHGPYAAKQCTACHVRGSNKLVSPINELCFNCHALNIVKQYVHGPLASGGCRVCHSPHGSAYPFLLVSEPKDFCYYCHDKDQVLANDVHKSLEMQCTACHDAHSSEARYLLK